MDIDNIDFNALRNDLIDYYGTAVSSNPIAFSDVIMIENASDMELLNIINDTTLDINNYISKNNTK